MRALAIAFGSLVVVVAALLLAVWLWVEPDQLREPLAAQLSAAIGQPVTIGELDLAVLPIPALRARDVRLGRARPGVPALAEIDEVRLRLRLLPLLVGRIALGAVEIRSPKIALPTDATGRPELPSGAAAAPDPAAAEEAAPLVAIDRIRVRDGRVEAGVLVLEGIDVDGRLAADGTAAIDFAVDLGRGGPGVRGGHADLEGLFGDSPRARVSSSRRCTSTPRPCRNWSSPHRERAMSSDATPPRPFCTACTTACGVWRGSSLSGTPSRTRRIRP